MISFYVYIGRFDGSIITLASESLTTQVNSIRAIRVIVKIDGWPGQFWFFLILRVYDGASLGQNKIESYTRGLSPGSG